MFELLQKVIESILTVIMNPELRTRSRFHPKSFTRERKMPFRKLVMFMLKMPNETIRLALNRFAREMDGESVTQQAFSKARNKFSHLPFLETFKATAACFPRTNVWNGYILNAIDGSTITLPYATELSEYFGTSGPHSDPSPTARATVRFDMLNRAMLDAEITPYTTGERITALAMLNRQEKLEKSINIYDRGYFSWDFAKAHIEKGIKFLCRLRTKFNCEIDDFPLGSHLCTINNVKLKVIKIMLKTGEIETLVTDVLDENISDDDFCKLYFLRWGIEGQYDNIKNKIGLEIFTGLTPNAIKQDFFSSLTVLNLILAAKIDADEKIKEKRKNKANKHVYIANTSFVVGTLKDNLIRAFLADENDLPLVMARIANECAACVVPVRPGRSFERKKPRKTKFHQNKRFNA